MQAVVYDVIIIGSSLNKDLVWKKAHESLATHRNTKMCDKLIAELREWISVMKIQLSIVKSQ